MKRYRHYQKGTAIVLAGFGSVVEQQMYLDLRQEIAEAFGEADVFLSFSSRMVLKHLNKEGKHYQNLPQTLAELDRAGYRRVVVASLNLFPTDEHELLGRIVAGFGTFSPMHIRATKAILHKTKETSLALAELDASVTDPDWANLYIIHGVPVLDLGGLSAVEYADGFLRRIGEKNFTCSLEGAYPYYAVKDALIREIRSRDISRVQIVPLLLISGNHYRKDMVEITEELGEHFQTRIAPSLSRSERFNLIELPAVRSIIRQNIQEEITKLGC
jgi:sirohydrochlorin cobaltochelatase